MPLVPRAGTGRGITLRGEKEPPVEFYSSLGNFPAARVPAPRGLRMPALCGRCPARDGLGLRKVPLIYAND